MTTDTSSRIRRKQSHRLRLLETPHAKANEADAMAVYLRGQDLEKGKQFTAAIEQYSRAIDLADDCSLFYFARAVACSSISKYVMAITDLNKALQLVVSGRGSRGAIAQPAEDQLYWRRGDAHFRLGNAQSALRDVSEALTINRKNAFALSLRAELHAHFGHHDAALADWSKAIELRPDLIIGYWSRWNYLVDRGKVNEALEDLSTVIKLDADNAYAFGARGSLQFQRGDYKEALEDLSQALKLDPDYTSGYMMRGLLYLDTELYGEALEDFNSYCELCPEDLDGYAYRGRAYRHLGRLTEAIADLTRALTSNISERAETLIARGEAYEQLGLLKDALDDYDLAVEIKPDEAGYQRRRDNLLTFLGEHEIDD